MQTLYKVFMKKHTAYSFDEFQNAISYLIKALELYASFFSILTLTFMLPFIYKLVLKKDKIIN